MIKEIQTDQLTSILLQYGLSGHYTIAEMESGMNNTTKRIIVDNEHYMLRIYDNHQESSIVEVEHQMLQALHQRSLTIQVPQVVISKCGNTYISTEQGKLVAMYRFINGNRPRAGYYPHIVSLGKAAALLTVEMASVTLPCSAQYDPYYLLPESYVALLQTDLTSYLIEEHKLLAEQVSDINYIMDELSVITTECKRLEDLPKQWIHGDIVCQNTVALEDEIIAILDFEFVAQDVRAMEPAVIAVDLMHRENWLNDCPTQAVAVMMKEYLQVIPLTQEELNEIPLLMKLRIFDVFLHVVTRYQQQLSPLSLLLEIIGTTVENLRYINESNDLQSIFFVGRNSYEFSRKIRL
ncbi:phosphotransferase [Paenibacillus yanchengensis]|uniref:Phosphotransferase n=1 Tax=Paenibacillus yanchengensis TaxID=2035833 RepID=A0ABW4YQ51_9BACL